LIINLLFFKYEKAITAKLIQYQQKKTLEINKTTAQILKETEFLEIQAKNNITMIYVLKINC